MYFFKDELTDNFFRFCKWLVRDQIWARLPLASKAIYPVIGVHCNKHGCAFPSEQTIAILSGISENTVRKGIHGLLEVPGFEVEKYVTARGYKANRYFIHPPPKRKDTSFFFHKLVVTGGNWMKLRSTAKALYPVLNTFSYYDQPAHNERAEVKSADYLDREFDFVDMDVDVMAEYAGISHRSLKYALDDLQGHFLIEETYPINEPGRRTWKIYVKPVDIYPSDHLNELITERYGNRAAA